MADATLRPFSGGTKMQWVVGAPGSIATDAELTDFGGVVGIGASNLQSDDVETTELDPYQGIPEDDPDYPVTPFFIKTFIAGFVDMGELPLEVNFTAAQYILALEAQLSRYSIEFRIGFRNGYTVRFSGYIKGLGLDAKASDLVKMPVTIKLDGSVFSIELT